MDLQGPSIANGVQFVEVDEESSGQRIDNFLFRILKGVPKSHVYRILRRGEVRINGGRARPMAKLAAGDTIRIPPVRRGDPAEAAAPSRRMVELIEKSIIYEDKLILVINKPAGIAVHGGSGLNAGVIEVLRTLRPQDTALELVHRLDRGTSGCLMISRRRSALRTLQEALREKSGLLEKHYLAVVHGEWPKRRTMVDMPLQKNEIKSGERISKVSPLGKPSLTRFERIAGNGLLTLVNAQPITGRTHQIRVHCAASGAPVVGDDKYGDEDKDRKVSPGRMMLHARRLVIPPLRPDQSAIEIEAPLDEVFQSFIKDLKNSEL